MKEFRRILRQIIGESHKEGVGETLEEALKKYRGSLEEFSQKLSKVFSKKFLEEFPG